MLRRERESNYRSKAVLLGFLSDTGRFRFRVTPVRSGLGMEIGCRRRDALCDPAGALRRVVTIPDGICGSKNEVIQPATITCISGCRAGRSLLQSMASQGRDGPVSLWR